MSMHKGKIGVTSENIFPVIKKFLYTDHEIFIRELLSNAVDATQKMKAIALSGEHDSELGDLTIRVAVDKDKKTLTISDSGVGMTIEEMDKYINQIAFSSAEEFMEKYKDHTIIGHFGLGFYSAFMVADRVEIVSQSYKTDEPTVTWSCDGTPEYAMDESTEKRTRGTDIILHIAEDTAEFLDPVRIKTLLRKYCGFLPVPIACGKVQEWQDGKWVNTDKDDIANDTAPLWIHKPTDVSEEQYREFYHKLYPGNEDPLFFIHLNIDYPFHLTGILYFPKIRNNFEVQKNKISLYSNQVYVTDSIEGIVPDFLTLLHGVIDSPDIPLNVSRSSLQSDSNVRKISGYITRKVSDRLQELFNNMREEYESKWDDLKIFIEYGIVTDEKFAEKASGFMLLKNTDNRYFTFDEYKDVIRQNQTDKNGMTIHLYADDIVNKHSFIEAARNKGYDVLVMDGQLDNHFISWYENQYKDSRFISVDSNVVERLIDKEQNEAMMLNSDQQATLRPVFESQMPNDDKIYYNISFEAMDASDTPVTIIRDEYMRRMKEMAAVGGGGMSQFYAQMPDNYTIVVNGNHPMVVDILQDVEKEFGNKLQSLNKKIDTAQKQEATLEKLIGNKKEEDITSEERQQREELTKKIEDLSSQRDSRLKEIGSNNNMVKQLIDLALLSSGMLKGEQLTSFIKRSVQLIGK